MSISALIVYLCRWWSYAPYTNIILPHSSCSEYNKLRYNYTFLKSEYEAATVSEYYLFHPQLSTVLILKWMGMIEPSTSEWTTQIIIFPQASHHSVLEELKAKHEAEVGW